MDDLLLDWATGGGGPAPSPRPVQPQPVFQVQTAPAVPLPTRDPAGNLVLLLPDAPLMTEFVSADPYQRFLAGLPELLPDLTGGRRVGGYPEGSNLRGVPREGMSDEEFRAYATQRYGADAAAFVSSPFDKARVGTASSDEKANWVGK